MSFFLLFFGGTRVRTQRLSEGHFHCPVCRTTRRYERCRVGNYVHLFWLPIFKLQDLGERVICDGCGRAFAGADLDASGPRPDATWVCRGCGNFNPCDSARCLRCGSPGEN